MLKSQGVLGLADDLKWLYSYFNPSVVRNMAPQHFIILTRTGALGLGEFPYPSWHKREKENILASVGIKVEYGEMPKQAEYKGTFKMLSDKERAELIRLYVEEGLSIERIAKRMGRSSRTPFVHINKHDVAVQQSGVYPICKRVQGKYQGVTAKQARAESAK